MKESKIRIESSSPVLPDSYGGDLEIQCGYSGLRKTVNEAAKLGWRREIVVDDSTGARHTRFRSNIGTV